MPRAQRSVKLLKMFAFAGLFALLGVVAPGAQGQPGQAGLPEKFTAFAVNLGTSAPQIGRPGADIIEITITRWSTAEERAGLIKALRNGGENGLLKALQEAPPTGTIRRPTSLAWDLHYAHQVRMPDGGRRIFLATDRPIGMWEAVNMARTLRYPFTLIEIHLDKNDQGEGKMSIATKISISKDGQHIELEDYASQPVRLAKVTKVK
jgi:hypothetical protein